MASTNEDRREDKLWPSTKFLHQLDVIKIVGAPEEKNIQL